MFNEFKFCKLCSIEKHFSEFHKNLNKDGRFNVCKKCHYKRNQEKRKDPKNKERFKEYRRSNGMFSRYGILPIEYSKIVEEQRNKCLICGNEPDPNGPRQNKNLHIDHCHKTHKVRGLLCHLCNRGIGLFRENIKLLEKAISYLEKHS